MPGRLGECVCKRRWDSWKEGASGPPHTRWEAVQSSTSFRATPSCQRFCARLFSLRRRYSSGRGGCCKFICAPRLPLLPRTASLQQGRSSKRPQRPSRTLPSPASEGGNSPHQGAASTRRKFAENFQGERRPTLPAKSRHLTKEANVLPPPPSPQSKQLSPR